MDPSEVLGVIEGLRNVFSEFSAGWFVGLSTVCYLVIQVLRGKTGFKIPYITVWIESLSKEVKTTVIVILFGVAGALLSLQAETITFFVIVDGFLAGIATGLGTIGARSVSKQSIEAVQKLKQSTQDNINNKS